MGVSDLTRVTHDDDFRAVADASEESLGLVAFHILELIVDDEAVGDRTAAHVDDGLELEEAAEGFVDALVDAITTGGEVFLLLGLEFWLFGRSGEL